MCPSVLAAMSTFMCLHERGKDRNRRRRDSCSRYRGAGRGCYLASCHLDRACIRIETDSARLHGEAHGRVVRFAAPIFRSTNHKSTVSSGANLVLGSQRPLLAMGWKKRRTFIVGLCDRRSHCYIKVRNLKVEDAMR